MGNYPEGYMYPNDPRSPLHDGEDEPEYDIEHYIENHYPHQEIADRFNISRSRVTQIANKMGYGRVTKKQVRLSNRQWHELLTQYPQKSVTELAKQYGVSRAAIYRRL